jgi:hypothetical protein
MQAFDIRRIHQRSRKITVIGVAPLINGDSTLIVI